jgi:bifunctional DNA-binding transcriptional regulator/antitoxin component of YhaV-PrlF toxin-antitoxin module
MGFARLSPVAAVIVRKVKVRDLPSELRAGLDAEPEDVVEVTVDAGHRRKLAELLALVEEVGAEAERRGLTDEKLAGLLDDR